MIDAFFIAIVLGIVSVAFIYDLIFFTNNINKKK
jgi:hypothetical protein